MRDYLFHISEMKGNEIADLQTSMAKKNRKMRIVISPDMSYEAGSTDVDRADW